MLLLKRLKKLRNFFGSQNDEMRQRWIAFQLKKLPSGAKILDAGAGECPHRSYCHHLNYVSQDFNQYKGCKQNDKGVHPASWDDSRIDIVSDITNIPVDGESFDAILCTEVFEHIPDPIAALKEFHRILKPGGVLLLTAPYSMVIHFAPYHFYTGFTPYWYKHFLPNEGFNLAELQPNGDWYSLLEQEVGRIGSLERRAKVWSWPLAYAFSFFFKLYFRLRPSKNCTDLASFGWFCKAVKVDNKIPLE